MDYLVYGRAASGAGHQDTPDLDEAHWSFMDAFAARMTARGPTLSADRAAWTGSLHVVDLDGVAAAQAFARDDPYQLAGLFREHLVRRFHNLLGRTMWYVSPRGQDLPFLVLADGGGARAAGPAPRPLLAQAVAERLVVWGALYPAADGPELSGEPCGVALGLLAPDEAAARALVAAESSLLGGHPNREFHAWEFGGRR